MTSSTKSRIPKVSVVSIALKPEEFTPLVDRLSCQTFQDYEFVGEAGGSIPEAWNRALQRACGGIVVFTETDAIAVDEHWLGEMVASLPDEKTVVKGLEVRSIEWDLSNLAGHRRVFVENQFDESFGWVAGSELLCRVKSRGYRLVQLQKAPVVHLRKAASRHYFRRAFRYGLYWARLRHRYADPVELASVANAAKVMVGALLNLLGMAAGWMIYWPERCHRKQQ